jgi:hypothetical protein
MMSSSKNASRCIEYFYEIRQKTMFLGEIDSTARERGMARPAALAA